MESKEGIFLIIDVHAHLGYDNTFDEEFTLKEQIEKNADNNIDISILQPGTCHALEDVQKQHDDIAAAMKANPGKFYGMANPYPYLSKKEYGDEIERCVEKLGFIGIKLHPLAHGISPTSKNALKAFEAASEFKIPLMVHTGAGVPFANPINMIPMAKRFPDVKIIIAHCGAILLAGETLLAMELCPNLYADTSWTPGFMIREWSHKVGADRFMMGSDHADNCATEITKIRTCGLDFEQQQWVLGKSAADVFNIKP